MFLTDILKKMLNLKVTVKTTVIVVFVYALIFYLLIATLLLNNDRTKKEDTIVSMDYVVVHLDLKGAPPKLEYLTSVLPVMKKYGANGLLIEYEDMFPFRDKIEGLSATYCYNKTEVLELHTSVAPVKFLHLGCDEVYHINTCLKCKARMLTNEDIFLQHIISMSELIRKDHPNITLLIWDDMLQKINPSILTDYQINKHVEPVIWDYAGTIKKPFHIVFKYFSVFDNVWIASSFKGAKDQTTILPDIATRYNNHWSWLKYIAEYSDARKDRSNFRGIFLTGWSRFNHFAALCELLPASMPSLILNLMFVSENIEKTIDSPIFPVDVSARFSREMNCDDYIPIYKLETDLKTCNFKDKSIYDYLQLLNVTETKVMYINAFYNFYTSENLEYYIAKNHVSPNRLHNMNEELGDIKNELKLIKLSLKEGMGQYFANFVIEEYVQYKIGHLETILSKIQDNLAKSESVKYWVRRHS